MNDFQTAVREEIQAMMNKLEEIEDRISPILLEKKQLHLQLDCLQNYLKTFEPEASKATPHPGIFGTNNVKKTAVDMIEQALLKIGRPVHYTQIHKYLRDQLGYDILGKNPLANLGAKLSTSPKFKKIGNGEWGLTQWKSVDDVV